jgi:hypothetical protein
LKTEEILKIIRSEVLNYDVEEFRLNVRHIEWRTFTIFIRNKVAVASEGKYVTVNILQIDFLDVGRLSPTAGWLLHALA